MILCIETSTAVLSVALARDGAVVCERVCTEPRSQAALTAPLVKEVLDAAGITAGECDAVCVSAGPGSYTGLRVGVSTAKGLAFGAGIPLLSMGTLDILVEGVEETPAMIVPMIDARRMEVYTAVYSAGGDRLTEVEARVIGPDAFAEYLEQGEVLFVGDGALKCQEVITHPNARFREAFPLARHMARRAQEDFDAGKFQDVAYFEPFYLKDFIATVSKKNLW
ncbi:MAG: tRNA (adenosine(37)-N6)-threonylcarbamoyltransferase complex dimerization subunit type 1 TsaB [Bacteroidales bacterium]|nr:tRNA (adenosine(37)-N6)-threonylcarbamoyltransferase complex dimerization subunit type 1 TsaB [Bacteroidales bacterium]